MPQHVKTLAIIPVSGHFGSARRAVESFLEHTPESYAIVVDDARPDGTGPHVYRGGPHQKLSILRFPENRGPTAAWNTGFERACAGAYRAGHEKPDYIGAANSDLIFSPGFDRPQHAAGVLAEVRGAAAGRGRNARFRHGSETRPFL